MAHHVPLKALGPIPWDDLPDADADLAPFLRDILSHAQTIVDSIPLPTALAGTAKELGLGKTGRSRSHTDSALPLGTVTFNRALAGRPSPSPSPLGDKDAEDAVEDPDDAESRRAADAVAHARALQPEWKEVKLSARDNPLAVNVYKLAGRDGRGAWFARRSVHEGMTFDKWKAGLEREFLETLRVVDSNGGGGEEKKEKEKAPGQGNIRGIGAERRVESKEVDGAGKIEVYQLSAQFPGPASPRDFVTLLLSSDATPPGSRTRNTTRAGTARRAPRQYMIISKPCVHPVCPQRQGFIRGQYESVEVIREIFVDRPLRKVRSSIDLSREDSGSNGNDNKAASAAKDAILRSARRAAASSDTEGGGRSISFAATRAAVSDIGVGGGGGSDDAGREDEQDTAIEWLMVTRSDPGGSVPRFLVEKGTPGAIVADAGKLLRWLESMDTQTLSVPEEEYLEKEDIATDKLNGKTSSQPRQRAPTINLVPDPSAQSADALPAPSGFYSMIAGALGAAGSAVATRLPQIPFSGSVKASSASESESEPESDDSSSIHSFASAEEGPTPIALVPSGGGGSSRLTPDMASTLSGLSEDSTVTGSTNTATTGGSGSTAAQTQHEKELRKLQDRYRKIQDKIERAHERRTNKNKGDDGSSNGKTNDNKKTTAKEGEVADAADADKEAAAAQERERAKLREKHERELAKQEEKYQKELRRLEHKRASDERKAAERARKAREKEERANAQLLLDRVRAERDVARKEIEVLKDTVGELQAQNTMLVARLGKLGALGEGGKGPGGGSGVGEKGE